MTYRKIDIDFLELFITSVFEGLENFTNISRGWIIKIFNKYYGRIVIKNDSLHQDITFNFIDVYKDNRDDYMNDLQECSICFEYTKHLTPCSHSVCKSCEDKLISYYIPLICPICRRNKFPNSIFTIRFPHKAYKQLFGK